MLSRTLSRTPTLATFSVKYGVSFGRKCRDTVARCGHYLKPLRKYLFRNFLMVHYFYIVSMTILTSILLYPVRNIRYIDILFLSTGTTTQGGLNTVNINELKLYQQIIIYIVTFLTTPIAINGTLAFVRLYWFERHFDGIKDFSKRYYKMRRTKTIIGRELSARTMSRGRQQRANTRQMSGLSHRNDDFQEKLFSGKLLNRDEQDSLAGVSDAVNDQHKPGDSSNKNYVDSNGDSSLASSNTTEDRSYIRPSGRGLLFKEPKPRRHHQNNGNETDTNNETDTGRQRSVPPESFARRRRSTDISPEDMYRSITMMKDQRQGNAEDEGPALVIGAPAERSKGKNVPRSSSKKQLAQPMKDRYPTGIQKRTNESREEKDDNGADQDEEEEKNRQSDLGRGTTSDTSSGLVSNNSDPSSSIESGSGGVEIEDSSSELSTNTIGDTSVHDPSATSLNVTTTNDGERANETNDTFSAQNQQENPTNRNGPSIHFDAAPPRRRKVKRSRRPTGENLRRRRRYRGIKVPKGISARLKRRLSIGTMERQPTKATNDRMTMNNLDDYFADDENDKEADHGSRDEASSDFQKANTLEQRNGLPEENYANVLGKSQTFDVGKSRDWNKLSATPEFQNLIYENWKKKNKGKGRMLRSRLTSAPTIPGFRSHNRDRDDDDGNDNLSMDQDQYKYPDNFLDYQRSDRGGSIDDRNSLDEEAGYFGNDLSFADTTDDPQRPKLARTLSANYLSWEPTVGRNSVFINLTKEQKEELGGVEYRAIKLLCRILVAYYGGFWVISFLFLVPWIVCRNKYREIVRSDNVAPAWWGFFTGMSAFCDLGLTLTPDSMDSFITTSYPTIIMMFFIILGNTGFPVFLRFIIWVLFQISPDLSLTRESLGFLLDHPRRCFTMLFPSAATWWLVVTLIGLNAVDLIIFVILDLGDRQLHDVSRGYRVLAGLFQAVCTRTAGFEIVDIGSIHPAVQISYMIMMYVSVMPMAISIRRTNVYEEGSLGIYDSGWNDQDPEPPASDGETAASGISESNDKHKKKKKKKKNKKKKKKGATSFIGAHLRRQLSFDLWFMSLGVFIICLAEGGKIRDTRRPDFNLFAIIFETVSAYGTVGMSLGYPGTDTAFSGEFTTISKLVVIALLLRGRHRGLPYTLDRAIILPSDKLDNMDQLQDLHMRNRSRRELTGDPITAYFKSKMRGIKRGIRALRTRAIEEEEEIIDDFRELPRHLNGESSDTYEDGSDDGSETEDVDTDYGSSSHGSQHDNDIGGLHAEPKGVSHSPQSASLHSYKNSSYPEASQSSSITPSDQSDISRTLTDSTKSDYHVNQ